MSKPSRVKCWIWKLEVGEIISSQPASLRVKKPVASPHYWIKLIRHFLKLSDTIPAPEIERAHRALHPIPDPGHPPRHIIICLLRWSDKNEVFKTLASAKGKLTWDGHDFRMFQDFPMEIQCQRDSYRELRSILRKENLRHGILYPARLIVTINEETFIFKNPRKLRKF
ncbi:hypothetical protein KUCAC02_019394 [Chaenocephalus aceratus]|uniref:Uncharacterized protein n=1 Tax=Chaenocephalus aceratus TaxID=36190 RepID=A0ACB9VNM8_CHAAC|nr:hypothetical protein KUCAC02_019394 [Chaenocephalus aceratus]